MSDSEPIVRQTNPVYRRRRRVNQAMLTLSWLMLLSGLFWLCWIVVTLIVKGGAALSFTLLTESTPPPGANGTTSVIVRLG